MNIGWIKVSTSNKFGNSGGNAYESYLLSTLSKKHNIDKLNYRITPNFFLAVKNLYEIFKLDIQKDFLIRDYVSALTLPFNGCNFKNILLIHHIDSDYLSHPFLAKKLDKLFFYNLKYIDTLVVVSKYWEDFFESIGSGCNIKRIYNCFDFEEFEFTDQEISDFKERYGLSSKPVVYIGNCQKEKGVVEVYHELKNLDVHLVTSGPEKVKIPAINLNLSHRDYLRLLKASSVVVTMSKFKEGWCRTAHEAMLCKTPVVGSGLGGMSELLDNGKQIICRDLGTLKHDVEYLLDNPDIGQKGYEYASLSKFSPSFFENRWNELIENL